ncbi:MAG: TIGR01777 family oxidoreductase [Verrucomicrobia bacterium]|nr:TIGR01777 family oxidoreductase [Verrucomicrobiota bacterium]
MNILITGASGFVGVALAGHLHQQGHTTLSLARGSRRSPPSWDPALGRIDLSGLPALDAVVHLAGENVAGGRWSAERKARILDSRTAGTRLLAEALSALTPRPGILISASGIGYYGTRPDETLDEASSQGQGFLAEVCRAWEAAADPARESGIRVVHPRIGMVLASHGGALGKMLLPFRLGLGGVVGSGQQVYSWISLRDTTRALMTLIEQNDIQGPVNLCAPNPVTNREFTRALGKALHRPTLCPLPAVVARTLLGEMADALLLSGQRALPAVLTRSGFTFDHPTLNDALASMRLR